MDDNEIEQWVIDRYGECGSGESPYWCAVHESHWGHPDHVCDKTIDRVEFAEALRDRIKREEQK